MHAASACLFLVGVLVAAPACARRSATAHQYSGTGGSATHAPTSRYARPLRLATWRSSSRRSAIAGARDSHGRLLRTSAARTAFARTHPCPATGRTSGACPGWVIDHVIALKRGGADDPGNMQWQTIAAAKAKDRWE